MKRLLLSIVLVLSWAGLASAQNVSVSGNIQNLTGSTPDASSFVRFILKNYTGTVPKVNGTAVLLPGCGQANTLCQDFTPVSGAISGTIYGNDIITPTGTFYTIQFWTKGRTLFSCDYNVTGPTFNINSAACLTTPSIAPGNVLGAKTFSCPLIATTSATCVHNFGLTNNIVECFDSNNKLLWPDTITSTDINTSVITFTSAQTGNCTIINGGNVAMTTAPANSVVTNPNTTQVINGAPLTVQNALNAMGGGILQGLFTGPTFTATLNNVLYVGDNISNTDVGTQLNNAYTALPSTGGKIVLLPKNGGGCYSFSTPVHFDTQGKYVILEGASGTSNAVGDVDGGSCLNYTPNTNTAAFTLGWGPTGGGGYSPGGGFRNITLKANGGCFAPGGCGNLATGIITSNGGVPQGNFQNVKIEGFATGWNYNDNSDGWGVQWIQFSLVNNTTGMVVNSSLGEEKLYWDGGQCAVNATCINSPQPATDLYIHAVSIDSNTVNGIVNGGTVTCVSCHFENLSTLNPSGGAQVQYITSGNAVTLIGGLVLNDNVSGTPAGQFFTTTTGFFSMYGTAVYSPNQNITAILNNTSAGSGNISVTTISPSTIGGICSAPQNCIGAYQVGANPSFQIPVLTIPETGASLGLGNSTQCRANSVTHILECNYDLSGTYQMTQTIASGNTALGTSPINAGTCATTVTVSAPGVIINDTLSWSFNGDPSSLAGYGVNTAGHLDIYAWPSADNVNFRVCNSTSSTLTPHSLQINWIVPRW